MLLTNKRPKKQTNFGEHEKLKVREYNNWQENQTKQHCDIGTWHGITTLNKITKTIREIIPLSKQLTPIPIFKENIF